MPIMIIRFTWSGGWVGVVIVRSTAFNIHPILNLIHVFPVWQILDQLFSLALSLPKPAGFSGTVDIELPYSALSSLEDVIAILRSVSSIHSLIFCMNFL